MIYNNYYVVALCEEQSNVTSPCGRNKCHWPDRAT